MDREFRLMHLAVGSAESQRTSTIGLSIHRAAAASVDADGSVGVITRTSPGLTEATFESFWTSAYEGTRCILTYAPISTRFFHAFVDVLITKLT